MVASSAKCYNLRWCWAEKCEGAMADEGQADLEKPSALSFAEFLETTPPNTMTEIADIAVRKIHAGGAVSYTFSQPDIQLHCSSDSCNGTRFFRHDVNLGANGAVDGHWHNVFLTYFCANCRRTAKTFAISVIRLPDRTSGRCKKFGELPEFGPPTPSRLIKLIGPDRELFLKGRRCENQGLGVGAFSYYRRVVENQKDRIIGQILEVSEKLSAPPEAIVALATARSEIQFSKSVSLVKDAIPQSLLINGHNPLTLLHTALSDGLHTQTDEFCLERAQAIRLVLIELSDRLGAALKDEAELKNAVSRLLNNP